MTSAISREAVLTELHDIVIPNVSGLENSLLVIAVFGVSIACALLVSLGVFQFTHLNAREVAPQLQDQISALKDMDDDEKIPQLLHLLKCHRPERFEDVRRFLYRPHSKLTSNRLLQELLTDEPG